MSYSPDYEKTCENNRSDQLNKGTWQIIVGLVLIICGSNFFIMTYIMGNLYFVGLAAIGVMIGCGFFAYGIHKQKNSFAQKSCNGPQETTDFHVDQTVPVKSELSKYEFLKIRLVGVTFQNEDGTSRQEILRKFRFRDPPFNGDTANVEMVPYEYEGEPAVSVDVNGLRFGHIPKEQAKFLTENIHRIIGVTWIDVIGGGETEEGERLYYGAEVTIKLKAI